GRSRISRRTSASKATGVANVERERHAQSSTSSSRASNAKHYRSRNETSGRRSVHRERQWRVDAHKERRKKNVQRLHCDTPESTAAKRGRPDSGRRGKSAQQRGLGK